MDNKTREHGIEDGPPFLCVYLWLPLFKWTFCSVQLSGLGWWIFYYFANVISREFSDLCGLIYYELKQYYANIPARSLLKCWKIEAINEAIKYQWYAMRFFLEKSSDIKRNLSIRLRTMVNPSDWFTWFISKCILNSPGGIFIRRVRKTPERISKTTTAKIKVSVDTCWWRLYELFDI